MDAALFVKLLSDPAMIDLKKLSYKYPEADMPQLISLLKASVYETLPLRDFYGNPLVLMNNITQVHMHTMKLLLSPHPSNEAYGLQAMEEEISATLTIESIDFSRDSVRKILFGFAPVDEREIRIYGIKKGLDFISDPLNAITEKNLFALYNIAIGQYLQNDEKLIPGAYYRHDAVHVVGQEIEHTGLAHQLIPKYMAQFVAFIQGEQPINDLLKAAVIHFYLGYIHPYFDGNGRMARLLHMWYLLRRGFASTLFIPFSSYVDKSRSKYYQAYSKVSANEKISGIVDVTPFLLYFIDNVYNKLKRLPEQQIDTMDTYLAAFQAGSITVKEKDLWHFVLTAYANREFSTKQLEKDFGNAAYATVRSFVMKFEAMGLLSTQRYANKVKYRVKL